MTQQTPPSEVARIFDAEVRIEEAESKEYRPRFNVAPTSRLLVVLQRADEGRLVEQLRWGLIPPWARSAREGARLINARAETVAASPAFRSSFRSRRCIVPADGFYEWQRQPVGGGAGADARGETRGRRSAPSQPYYLRPPEGGVLALAGMWSAWKDPDTDLWLLSATVITTRANQTVSPIHDRMPVLLPREAWAGWLDVSLGDVGHLTSLLEPAPDDVLEIVPVSVRVNSVRNDGPELIEPVSLGA